MGKITIEVDGAGEYLSAPIPFNARSQGLSLGIDIRGDIVGTWKVEGINATAEEEAINDVPWFEDDEASGDLPPLEITTLVPDTSKLRFAPFEDESPDLTATVATLEPLPDCTASGSGVGKTLTMDEAGVLTIDGHDVELNDLVLVKNQVNQKDNGLYKCTTEGIEAVDMDPAVAAVLTRSTSMDASGEADSGTTVEATGGEGGQGVYVLMGEADGIALLPRFKRARLRAIIASGSGQIHAWPYTREL